MSVQTWESEFYPSPADEASGSEREALDHSLRKWIGLRPENLERHGLRRFDRKLTDGLYRFDVDSTSCALCERHSMVCDTCSLTEANGGFSCDGIDCRGLEEGEEGPDHYGEFLISGDPEPMIKLIQKAIEQEDAK